MLPQEVWRSDMEFTRKHLSEATVRGYHYWAIPYVRLMRKSPLAEKIMWPLAKWRAEELAYQVGRREKPNYMGKLVRLTLEPVCYVIGLVAPQKDWEPLWQERSAQGVYRIGL